MPPESPVDSLRFPENARSKFLFCPFWRLDCLKRWWCEAGRGPGEDRAKTGRGAGEAWRGPGEERARPGEEPGECKGARGEAGNARVWRVWTRKPGKVKFTECPIDSHKILRMPWEFPDCLTQTYYLQTIIRRQLFGKKDESCLISWHDSFQEPLRM